MNLSFPKLSLLTLLFIALTAAVPANNGTYPDKEKIEAAKQSIEMSLADGKLTTKELQQAAAELKGKKLTMKEKFLLKIFGRKISKKMAPYAAGEKSQLVALLLCIFIGGIGVHRFYLGYTWQGIVQLLTLGGLGVWTLIDLIRIITGSLKPKNGEYDKTL